MSLTPQFFYSTSGHLYSTKTCVQEAAVLYPTCISICRYDMKLNLVLVTPHVKEYQSVVLLSNASNKIYHNKNHTVIIENIKICSKQCIILIVRIIYLAQRFPNKPCTNVKFWYKSWIFTKFNLQRLFTRNEKFMLVTAYS